MTDQSQSMKPLGAKALYGANDLLTPIQHLRSFGLPVSLVVFLYENELLPTEQRRRRDKTEDEIHDEHAQCLLNGDTPEDVQKVDAVDTLADLGLTISEVVSLYEQVLIQRAVKN